MVRIFLLLAWLSGWVGAWAKDPWPVLQSVTNGPSLAGTEPLTMEGDIAAEMISGIHDFLERALLDRTVDRSHGDADTGSASQLKAMIGLRDERISPVKFVYYSDDSAQLARGKTDACTVYNVRWPVFERMDGVGILYVPHKDIRADVIFVPDADGFPGGADPAALAASGCRVLVPMLIDRKDSGYNMSRREWLYRPAFQLGRHIIGYEVAKMFSAAECLVQSAPSTRPLGIAGVGEGGLIALYAGALCEPFDVVSIAGYFAPRGRVSDEPAYRNVFGLLEWFGDPEIAAMIAPRKLVLHNGLYPKITVPSGTRAKPGVLKAPGARGFVSVEKDLLKRAPDLPYTRAETAPTQVFFEQLVKGGGYAGAQTTPAFLPGGEDIEALQVAQVAQIDRHNQWLLRESPYIREAFWKDLKTDSLASFVETVESYRNTFKYITIGSFSADGFELLPAKPRSRLVYHADGVEIYEVVLDVYPDVIAYGLLLKPTDIKPGERRPVVVCQHGLEGRPQHVIGKENFRSYKAFATRLAQEGFVTFAPQNIYIFKDRFRSIQFKANSIGKTLFSFMVPQHQQIVKWLGEQPYVDKQRIGFYGLSYGGKSAMRIPPLVPGYKAVICSADFNEWIWKNASTRAKYSYAQLGEYEIFEWNLGMSFNYADMAALIAPRPFMVERGHFDGVAPDEKVAHEYARVRRLYTQLGIADRTEIEWFNGPHTINGQGTFKFLHRHLGPVRQP